MRVVPIENLRPFGFVARLHPLLRGLLDLTSDSQQSRSFAAAAISILSFNEGAGSKDREAHISSLVCSR